MNSDTHFIFVTGFVIVFSYALFKVIHKILQYVHEQDVESREMSGARFANPIKEGLNNPKGFLGNMKD